MKTKHSTAPAEFPAVPEINRRYLIASLASAPALALAAPAPAAAAVVRIEAPTVHPELARRIIRFEQERKRLDLLQERHNAAEEAYLHTPENPRPDPLPGVDDEWRAAFAQLRVSEIATVAEHDHPAFVRRRQLEADHKAAMAVYQRGCAKSKAEIAFDKIDAAYQRQISRNDDALQRVMSFRPKTMADLQAKLRLYDLWNGEAETAFYHLWWDVKRITRLVGKAVQS